MNDPLDAGPSSLFCHGVNMVDKDIVFIEYPKWNTCMIGCFRNKI